jgi:hypothetical protein
VVCSKKNISPNKAFQQNESLTNCGNNGQGNPVDNLYLKRVKSTLTGNKQKHLHLYRINGRSRLGSSGADPIQVGTGISNNFM